jgi:hypothetical protein
MRSKSSAAAWSGRVNHWSGASVVPTKPSPIKAVSCCAPCGAFAPICCEPRASFPHRVQRKTRELKLVSYPGHGALNQLRKRSGNQSSRPGSRENADVTAYPCSVSPMILSLSTSRAETEWHHLQALQHMLNCCEDQNSEKHVRGITTPCFPRGLKCLTFLYQF